MQLDKFASKNISDNVTVNWESIKKSVKDSTEIYEIEVTEKNRTKIESSLFQKELKYELIAVKNKGEVHSYLVEAYSSVNHALYTNSVKDLKKFTGTLNVFELDGTKIAQLVVFDGKAVNPSKNNSLNPLVAGINLFYEPKNTTSKLPQCFGSFQVRTDEYVDRYNVAKTSTGRILGIFYMGTTFLGSTFSYMAVPYSCDQAGDSYQLIQRQSSYRDFLLMDLIDDSVLDPCYKGVMDALKNNTNCEIATVFNKLNANFTKYNTVFKNAETQNGGAAEAIRTSQFNYIINISQTNYTTGTKLYKANALLHELVHVYFMSLLDDYNTSGTPPNPAVFYEFPILFQKYVDKTFPLTGDVHHEEMANTYVDAISSALQEYQTGLSVPYGAALQAYKDLAWYGLKETSIFDKKFPEGSEDYKRIVSRFGAESSGGYSGGLYPIGNPCN